MPAFATRITTHGVVIAFMLIASGCATRMFEVPDVSYASFVDRSVTQTIGKVRISATVPTAEEVVAISGLDLYQKGIQPVWLRVENNESQRVRVALYSIDDEYFPPMEVAWYFRKGYSRDGRAAMERWFHENTMPRIVPPGETRSGLIFTHIAEGTKGFNVDAFTTGAMFNFTFFVPMPGFRPDYMDVQFENLYGTDDIQNLDLEGLRQLLDGYDCCSTDSGGMALGDPFNVVIVATPIALRRALLRSDWQETVSGSPESALARRHYFQGRVPDGTFHRSRPDGSEKKELRIWLAPIRVDNMPVWLAQASYDMSGRQGNRTFEDYRIDPDLDDARAFVLQSFWYGQSLAKFGMSAGVPGGTIDQPQQNFIGNSWFTDGGRLVMVISEQPVAMDETEVLTWERFVD